MQEDTNHINDELLIKYLLDETNLQERQEVEDWLLEDAANRKQFEDYKLIWMESRKLAAHSHMDEDMAWERMKLRLQQKTVPAKLIRKPGIFSISRMAAIWILLIAGASLATLYFLRQTPATLLISSDLQIVRDTLPDGSMVTLNKRSAITYPEKFTKDTREIILKGEGFFNITPDKNKPFIIRTGDVRIRVVGTSFNVRNINGNTEVIVETGVVQVSNRKKTIELKPGEKVMVHEKDEALEKQVIEDKLYNYYASKEFVCVNTPLWKLVEILNEAYGVHITIARKELGRLPLTTTFNNESLDKVLLVISQTFNITVERTGDNIVLN